jgi:hypothetical protein
MQKMDGNTTHLQEPFSISLNGHQHEHVAKDDFELLKLIGRGSFGKVCVLLLRKSNLFQQVLQVRKRDTGNY